MTAYGIRVHFGKDKNLQDRAGFPLPQIYATIGEAREAAEKLHTELHGTEATLTLTNVSVPTALGALCRFVNERVGAPFWEPAPK